MDREPVDSSIIASRGYDADTETMHVEFKSGLVYEYTGVPQDKWDEWQGAESAGTHFGATFRHWHSSKKLE